MKNLFLTALCLLASASLSAANGEFPPGDFNGVECREMWPNWVGPPGPVGVHFVAKQTKPGTIDYELHMLDGAGNIINSLFQIATNCRLWGIPPHSSAQFMCHATQDESFVLYLIRDKDAEADDAHPGPVTLYVSTSRRNELEPRGWGREISKRFKRSSCIWR